MLKHSSFASLDELVTLVNDVGVLKDDIIKIHFWNGRWYLVYWEP